MLNETGQIIAALTLSLALPVILIVARMWRERGSVGVTAKIIEIDEVHGGEGGASYYPTFEVVAGPHDGKTYRSEWDCGPSAYEVGEYVRANIFPETGEIYGEKRAISNWAIWFSPFVVVLMYVLHRKLF